MNKNPKILKTLDNSTRFFYWDFDVVIVGFFPLIIGMGMGFKYLAVAALPICWIYSILKRRYPKGMLMHKLYWSLPTDSLKSFGIKGKIPPSHKRRYFF